MLEETYATASKGCSGYGLKVIETARANSNAAFDLFGELLTAKSYSEVVEKTTAYMRTQFETVTAQAKELSEQAQKVCDRDRRADQGKLRRASARPPKSLVNKTMPRAAIKRPAATHKPGRFCCLGFLH